MLTYVCIILLAFSVIWLYALLYVENKVLKSRMDSFEEDATTNLTDIAESLSKISSPKATSSRKTLNRVEKLERQVNALMALNGVPEVPERVFKSNLIKDND